MELSELYKLLPIIGGIFISIAVFKMGKAMRSASDQSAYFELEGEKLKYKSAEFNGTNYGLCLEFLVSENHLGFRCYFPAFNYVVKYNDIAVSKVKDILGYRVSLNIPYIGEIKINRRLAKKLSRLSNGKIPSEIT